MLAFNDLWLLEEEVFLRDEKVLDFPEGHDSLLLKGDENFESALDDDVELGAWLSEIDDCLLGRETLSFDMSDELSECRRAFVLAEALQERDICEVMRESVHFPDGPVDGHGL